MAITDILDEGQLVQLRAAYEANLKEMALALSLIELSYPPVEGWLESIGSTVFTELSATPAPDLPLSPVDRERCLIALIAGRRETLNLAVHIYMGLMTGLSPAEVANVLALSGVYTGLSAYVRGIRVADTTLKILAGLTLSPVHGPKVVLAALNVAFATTWGG